MNPGGGGGAYKWGERNRNHWLLNMRVTAAACVLQGNSRGLLGGCKTLKVGGGDTNLWLLNMQVLCREIVEDLLGAATH